MEIFFLGVLVGAFLGVIGGAIIDTILESGKDNKDDK